MKVALKELLLKLLGDRIEHKVVEISGNGIAWYDMIDWDTDDPWDFDGYIEEEEA